MTLCNEHKHELCHEHRECPACLIQEELNTAEAKVEELKTEIEALKDEVKDLKSQIE